MLRPIAKPRELPLPQVYNKICYRSLLPFPQVFTLFKSSSLLSTDFASAVVPPTAGAAVTSLDFLSGFL